MAVASDVHREPLIMPVVIRWSKILSQCDTFAEIWSTLLGNGTINSDAAMEHETPRQVTIGSTAGNGVFYAVRADSNVIQQLRNCGKRCSLWVRAEAVYIWRVGIQINQSPCGGEFKYLHRSLASRRKRWIGNPVPGGTTGPPCSWGI
jgi:hypothetical protein